MLTEFTTPGPALTVDDDATIYSLLTTRLANSAENAPLDTHRMGPARLRAGGHWRGVRADLRHRFRGAGAAHPQ